jgi:hypothetical protein
MCCSLFAEAIRRLPVPWQACTFIRMVTCVADALTCCVLPSFLGLEVCPSQHAI